MRKISAIVIVLVALQSCSKAIQLKNKYSTDPVVSVYDKPKNDVWEAVMSTVVEMNLPVNLIEKESGVVSSYQSSFVQETTYEDLKGKELLHKDALIVTHRPNFNNDNFLKKAPSAYYTHMFPFESLTGRWKIQISAISASKTEVRVILGGFEFIRSDLFKNIKYYPEIYSLQNFEKKVLDSVKAKLK